MPEQDIVERCDRIANEWLADGNKPDQREAAFALNASAREIEHLRGAIEAAHDTISDMSDDEEALGNAFDKAVAERDRYRKALEGVVEAQAARSLTGSIVAHDEQSPWIANVMIALQSPIVTDPK